MIETLFSQLTNALQYHFSVALAAAFGWGILSIILSPCHLSAIPLVIGYISSQGKIKFQRSVYLALYFSIGILITITLIGIITASIGRLLGDIGYFGNYFIAGIFILVGLYLMNIIRLDWNRFQFSLKLTGSLWGALVLGLIFGLAVGPCTFAFLAPVLGIAFSIASENLTKALSLIFAFAIGHCAIIVVAGSLTNLVQNYLNWDRQNKISIYLRKLLGCIFIISGFYFIYISII